VQVAVDATPLLGPVTGVGRLVVETLPRLARRPDLHVVAFASTWRGRHQLADAAPPEAEVVTRPLPARPARAFWKRTDLPPLRWWTGAVDVVHGTNYVVPPSQPAAEIMTIHDLTCVRFPELCNRDTLEYPGLIRRALARGAWVHAVSQFTAAEVQEAFTVDPDRLVVIPNGVSAPLEADPAEGRHLAGAERYVLALGTVEPRKDLPSLVRAFSSLAAGQPDLRLVLAGPDGWGADALAQAIAGSGVGDRITRLGWLDDPERSALLRGAAVLAYPSVYEGFGLPPLEAMAAGVPVVSTTAGSLPEVLGEAALLVPPHDAEALAGALEQVLTDTQEADRLVAAGRAQAGRWSWDATADGLAELYHRAST
jgi:glycosyltransferase involved in cell wall biosynthesis